MKFSDTKTSKKELASPGARFQAAMLLAVIADAPRIFVFPLFGEGAFSQPMRPRCCSSYRPGELARMALGVLARICC